MTSSPYIDPPPPPDDEEIIEGWTWGEHRQMEKMLKQLEEQDNDVAEARRKLDQRLIEGGYMADPELTKPQVCKECGQPDFKPHDEECSYRPARPEEIPVRDAHGYIYLDSNFVQVHMTSVPCNDEEALDYFRIVDAMIWDREVRVQYIYKRALGEHDYKMMPYQYFRETGDVIPIGNPGA